VRIRDWCLLGFFFTVSSFSLASTVSNLKEQVSQTRAALERTQKKWHNAQKSLQQLERQIAVDARELGKLDNRIRQNKLDISSKKSDLAANRQKLDIRLAQLAHSLRGMDQWLNEPALKWVLTSNDPGDWSRLATYHRIMGHSQQELITELKALQQQILQDETELEQLSEKLKQEKAKQELGLVKLQASKTNREQLVEELQVTVREKSHELAKNESRLRSVLRGLSSSRSEGSGQFARLKGHLSWPIDGQLNALFNQSIQGSELKWEAVLFKAPEDRDVRAVAPGQVVYADWMSGYGWLIIIEHDDGYMTLYGRNHYLYKQVGEKVSQGEMIARSGKSGGFNQPALYFSLRHNAEPLDPAQWLSHQYSA
jgi:septal ring factor EnvC (AmiA/AmiB activator)